MHNTLMKFKGIRLNKWSQSQEDLQSMIQWLFQKAFLYGDGELTSWVSDVSVGGGIHQRGSRWEFLCGDGRDRSNSEYTLYIESIRLEDGFDMRLGKKKNEERVKSLRIWITEWMVMYFKEMYVIGEIKCLGGTGNGKQEIRF